MNGLCALAIAFSGAAASAVHSQGIVFTLPEEGRLFEYVDTFETPRVLTDAFLDNADASIWTPGALVSQGPYRRRTVTYRFFGDCRIAAFQIEVDQAANGRNLGGYNYLYVSKNGLDWQVAADSRAIEAEASGWQRGTLTVPKDISATMVGGAEVWIRLVLDNSSGLATGLSNRVEGLTVRIELGEAASEADDPQSGARQTWNRVRQQDDWRTLTLDAADPVGARPPHYYEDADGWLHPPGSRPAFASYEYDGFAISRIYRDGARTPLSLAAFVRTRASETPIAVRVGIESDATTHRALAVEWDGAPIAEMDGASFFEVEREIFGIVPAPIAAGVHELRVCGRDADRWARIRRIEVAGPAVETWTEKPVVPSGTSIEVLSAYYMADPPPPPDSQAVEGRSPGQGLTFGALQRFYREHDGFGAVRIAFRNTGTAVARVGDTIHLNGVPIEQHYVDFVESPWDACGVVWYRVRPRTLAPGACGQAYIRFRRRPEGEAADIVLSVENGVPVSARVPYTMAPVSVDYVAVDEARTMVCVYARRQDSVAVPLRRVYLDGVERAADIHGAGFPGGVALACIALDQPLEMGAYHVAGAEMADGARVDAQFRVLPPCFPRSSIHVPEELAASMHMNLFTWLQRDEDSCLRTGLPTTAMHGDVLRLHEHVPYIFAPDEPDAKDDRGGGYLNGLGWHARTLEESGWQSLVERHVPPTASWMNMDGTIRPLNWAVYGQFGDVNGFDPYPVTYYHADHAYVRESLDYVRLCAAPTPMFAILEAYGWQSGQGVPESARGPTPAEYRQNVVQAIGAGMKGLTSWVYSACAGGWQLNDALAAEMARVNALLACIEPQLVLAVPAGLVEYPDETVPTGTAGDERWPKPRVWARSLVCGPDALMIAVVNHVPASKPDLPTLEPARDVSIGVRLPEYLRDGRLSEATERGLVAYPCEVNDVEMRFRIDELESGRVFLLRR
ncbi:MAG TPA: hypothetical protein PLO37_15450 [Candidatus Hydrogenedentes bacterium]|mgnify:CR=1 FL=1|nr:hypothetical protein [Candidatus Hydrogenedentota bacterium]HPG68242.1 hypothetical protein [Candidatus Hydrogenedentota bacterium]